MEKLLYICTGMVIIYTIYMILESLVAIIRFIVKISGIKKCVPKVLKEEMEKHK